MDVGDSGPFAAVRAGGPGLPVSEGGDEAPQVVTADVFGIGDAAQKPLEHLHRLRHVANGLRGVAFGLRPEVIAAYEQANGPGQAGCPLTIGGAGDEIRTRDSLLGRQELYH